MIMPTPETLLQQWLRDLQADRASSTVYRYAGAIAHFLTWYHEHEHRPLTLTDLTPIALVGYRMALQQTAKPSTVNTHVCALRAWCAWLQEQGYLEVNPARRFKLVHRQASAAPRGLTPAQANALLRAATRTRHPERDVAIVQLLLQSGALGNVRPSWQSWAAALMSRLPLGRHVP